MSGQARPVAEPDGTLPHKLEIVQIRDGSLIHLAPGDRVMFIGTEDDLSVGGQWHSFAVLRATPPGVRSRP